MFPPWTPDGKYISFTNEKFNGLWLSDSKGRNLKQISNDTGVGYGYSWTNDATYVVVRPTKYINNRKLNTVKIIDIKNSKESMIEEYSFDLKGIPQWKNGGSSIQIRKKDKIHYTKSGLDCSSKLLSKIETKNNIFETIINYPTKCCNLIPSLRNFKNRIIFNAKISPDSSCVAFNDPEEGIIYLTNIKKQTF